MSGNQERKRRLSEKLIGYITSEQISGNEFGKRLDVSQTSAQAYIDGRTFPGEEIRARIAKLLKITMAELDAELDGREFPRRLTVEDLRRELRLLSQAEFVELAPAFLERLQTELQSCIK